MGNAISLRKITVPQLPEQDTWAAKMRAAVRDAIAPEDVAAVARKIVSDAKAGNRQAQTQLLAMLNSGPKSVTVNQYLVRRRRKDRDGEGTAVHPRRTPTIEECRQRVVQTRTANGKPVRVPPLA